MRITVLGSGTSQGVPMIGESIDLALYQDKRNWRTRSSIHVEMGGTHIQVDAAQEFRLQCLQTNVRAMDLFILTHGHADHISGMDDIRRFNDLNNGAPMPVYSTPEGLQRIQDMFPYAIGSAEKPGYPAFDLRPMPHMLELPCGSIASCLLPHGRIQVLGLVFTEKASGQKAAYFTDCSCVTPEAQALARGADIVILDGLRHTPHPTHMTIAEAIKAAQRIQAPRSYLTHLSAGLDHSTLEASLPKGIHLAYDGLVLS